MAYTPPGRTRQQVLAYVVKRLRQGNPPSVREVQEAFGFRSVESARSHLEALVTSGQLTQVAGQARGFRLPSERQARPLRRGRFPSQGLVPLVGSVQAGELTTALEEPEGHLMVQAQETADLFALRVRGESMIDAGIHHGDVVIVRRQPTARSGDIVVALVEDEATVKTFRRQGRRVVLEPANADFEPIVPDPRGLTILGKVIEVRRYFEGVPLVGSDPS